MDIDTTILHSLDIVCGDLSYTRNKRRYSFEVLEKAFSEFKPGELYYQPARGIGRSLCMDGNHLSFLTKYHIDKINSFIKWYFYKTRYGYHLPMLPVYNWESKEG